jgi:hypothetical protein
MPALHVESAYWGRCRGSSRADFEHLSHGALTSGHRLRKAPLRAALARLALNVALAVVCAVAIALSARYVQVLLVVWAPVVELVSRFES